MGVALSGSLRPGSLPRSFVIRIVNGEKITRILLPQTTLLARLHPGSTPDISLVSPLSSAPTIADLNTGITTVLPVTVPDPSHELAAPSHNKFSDGTLPFTPTAACFSKSGDSIYVGNSKGGILVIDHKTIQVYAKIPITGSAAIKNMVFSRNGKYLLTNSNDRTIRIYENLLPRKNGLAVLDDLKRIVDEVNDVEKLKAIGSKCLSLFQEFQDSITRMHWKAPCFSGDGEWVIAGSASKGEHKSYIWDRVGFLVKILEGPKEALIDLAWHPLKPIVVSVSLTGIVYIWAYIENWSAFTPYFKELEENEESYDRDSKGEMVSTRLKGRRKPLEKGLEMQAEKVKKPMGGPLMSSTKLSKPKTKSSNQVNGNGVCGDDDSDD